MCGNSPPKMGLSQYLNEEREMFISIRYNPHEAYLDSEFIQDMANDHGSSVEDAIVGDISAELEMDGITSSSNVNDITDLVGIIKGLLRYAFEEVSSFNDLTLEEKEAVETPENFERLRQFASEGVA